MRSEQLSVKSEKLSMKLNSYQLRIVIQKETI
jgi:hypothetical protein